MAEPYELGIELSRKNFGSGSLCALGIGAASFANVVYGASKDRAESPTASPERPNQLTIDN